MKVKISLRLFFIGKMQSIRNRQKAMLKGTQAQIQTNNKVKVKLKSLVLKRWLNRL